MEFQLVGVCVCVCPSCSILHSSMKKDMFHPEIETIEAPVTAQNSTVEYHEAVRFGQVDSQCQGDGVDTIP